MTSGVRLKWLLREVDDRADQRSKDFPLLSVSIVGGVQLRSDNTGPTRAAGEDLSNYKFCNAGELVINRMRAFQGALGIAPESGLVSPDYSVLSISPAISRRWLSYLLRSDATVAAMASLVRGIGGTEAGNVRTPRLNVSDLHSVRIDLKPLDEQRAIADFLDRETARIDTLIEEQQRLIELLRERRGSLVARTLLRGRAEPSYSQGSHDSRPGEIPAHWQLVPTRYLCTITTGSEDSGNATDDGEYPFYVRGQRILRIGQYSFEGEAVMTPGDGQGGTGKVFHYFDGRFEAHQRVYVFKDFSGILGRYFYYFLATFLEPVALAGSNTVTMESLRRPVLADFAVALPPHTEQVEILQYLDEQTSNMDSLVAEAEKFIKLSHERRSALITAAVTGQIDVRDGVA